MNNFFEKKNVEKLWWYGLNILTTLFIVSFVNINAPQGPAGSPGSNGANGSNGVNGQDGAAASNVYPVSSIQYEAAPVGAARAAYVQARIEEGFIPISTIEDFAVFTETEEGTLDQGYFGNEDAFDQNYVLTADLDFFGEDITNFYDYRIPAFTMRDFDRNDARFSGIFDGAGYTIRNYVLELGETDYPVAFIPSTDESIIRNITFENHKVTSVLSQETGGVVGVVEDTTILQNVTMNNLEVYSDDHAGGVIGKASDDTYLFNVKVNLGQVVSARHAGGLIGFFSSDDQVVVIQDSVNRANVDYTSEDASFLGLTDTGSYGGLVGSITSINQLTILNSVNVGVVNGLSYAGGLIGELKYNDLVVIANSYNAGFVGTNLTDDVSMTFGEGQQAGGLIGYVEQSKSTYIQNSYNVGQVFTYNGAGGLVGILRTDENSYTEPFYITNSYNAGFISTMAYGDGHAGLVGHLDDYNNKPVLIIENAFNVSQFSRSISRDDLGRIVRDNGAIIGDTGGGIFTLDNVRYYVNLDDEENYITHALDQQLDTGVAQSNDFEDFTMEAFYLSDVWDFADIWTFTPGEYDFPVLRELPVVLPEDNRSFDFHVDSIDVYGVEIVPNNEIGQNEIVIQSAELRIHHVDLAGEEMPLEFYGTRSTPSSLDDLKTNGELFHSESNGQSRFIDGEDEWIYYAPTLGDGEYYLYVVAYDLEGNHVMVELYTIDYTEGTFVNDTEAPVPGNGGALSAEFTFFPDDITFTFVEAMDNITSQENLGYVAVVAQSGFDFTTWDFNPEISEILGYNEFTNLNIAAGSYVFEDDFFEADFNTRYEVALIVFDEANNYAYYQTTFVENIE